MKKHLCWLLPMAVVLVTCLPGRSAPQPGASVQEAKKLFSKPPREYSTIPFWVWNDFMTDEQVRRDLREYAAQNIKQIFVHPRPGLMTPYLSPEWFRLWRLALAEARKLDMDIWIYDENSYPSGFAGGLVPELMPESRGLGLKFVQTNHVPKWSANLVGVYRQEGEAYRNVTDEARVGQPSPSAAYLIALEIPARNAPKFGDRSYVNLLTPGVTEKFLEVTLEPYRKEFRKHFGKRIPGVFTDEPRIRPTEVWPWSKSLPGEFQKRWGYDLLSCLSSLDKPVGDWRKVRHNYFQLLHELFVERWAKPYYGFCETNGLAWTGHYWEHDWPKCEGVPDNMAMYAWHQLPAIDCLMNQYKENTHAQFGNVRIVRELTSVANQLGRKRTLCEAYGASGWDLRFEDMKQIGDWLQALGVNTINQHLTYATIRGARKRDHPPSFSYHAPWWPYYKSQADYFARLSAAMSQGEQVNRVLVLEPTTTAWMYQGDTNQLKVLGDAFFNLLLALEAAQIEYDLGSEDILEHHAGLPESGPGLRVGRRTYDTVVIPPLTENLNAATRKLLDKARVTKLGYGTDPMRTDGTVNSQVIEGSDCKVSHADIAAWAGQLARRLHEQQRLNAGFAINRAAGDKGLLFHHRRQLKDGELLFLVNTSSEHPSHGEVLAPWVGAEEWSVRDGVCKPYPSSTREKGITLQYHLPPAGSLLLASCPKATKIKPAQAITRTVLASSAMSASRAAPNVLTLDYMDVKAGGETRTNLYAWQANQFAWRQNGMERNPWESGVQFKDELLKVSFPPPSGVDVTYRFTIRGEVPRELEFVVEQPDRYSVTCNGRPVKAKAGAWWLDRAFGRLDISSSANLGENLVVLRASPFTIYHELEPAYVLGNFVLEPVERGFEIASARSLRTGAEGWNQQGCPFYGDAVNYSQSFALDRTEGSYVVHLPEWRGSVAVVSVNGKVAGSIEAPPYDCDVTGWIKRGANEITVKVIGTLRNTLGPHHGEPPTGSAWPRDFHAAPHIGPPAGATYKTISYGLFQPFLLKQTVPEL